MPQDFRRASRATVEPHQHLVTSDIQLLCVYMTLAYSKQILACMVGME